MALKEFSLKNLESLDYGKCDALFRSQLKRVAADILDRPADDRPREVNMKILVKPVVADDGTADTVRCQVKITSKVPTHQTKVYELALYKNGQLGFSEGSPGVVDQTTFLDEEE